MYQTEKGHWWDLGKAMEKVVFELGCKESGTQNRIHSTLPTVGSSCLARPSTIPCFL